MSIELAANWSIFTDNKVSFDFVKSSLPSINLIISSFIFVSCSADVLYSRPIIHDILRFVVCELFSKSENTMLSVKIDQFAASSIDIKLICFTKTRKYLEWMKVKDLLALEIKNIVEKNNASFAFPSTSVYVEKN